MDYYQAVSALFAVWKPHDIVVWNPACGPGTLSTVLDREGYAVVSTDIADGSFGLPGVDFFAIRHPESPTVICEPPRKTAQGFVLHAKDIGIETLAMIMPASFCLGRRSTFLWATWRPRYILTMPWSNCSWGVWLTHDNAPTEFAVLRKPKKKPEVRF